MKLRNFFNILGLKGKTKRYGYRIVECDLEREGLLNYAIWQHPDVLDHVVKQDHVDAYREFINEGDFCIDIGAHTGDSTLPIALAAGPSGAVLAMEPNPYVFPVLEKNARLNQDKYRIIPLLAAAGETEGEMVFEYSDPDFVNGGRHEGMSVLTHGHPFKLSVHVVNLLQELQSDFSKWLPKLKYIKVDVEGYDLTVLRSLADVIENYRPYCKVEVFKRTKYPYRCDLLAFFKDRNYEVFHVAKEPCIAGVTITQDNLEQWHHYDVIAIPL